MKNPVQNIYNFWEIRHQPSGMTLAVEQQQQAQTLKQTACSQSDKS
jgi:hypothetical protein